MVVAAAEISAVVTFAMIEAAIVLVIGAAAEEEDQEEAEAEAEAEAGADMDHTAADMEEGVGMVEETFLMVPGNNLAAKR